MGEPDSISLDRLLSHRAWLKRMVMEMVGAHTAEDILQETWLTALRRPPRQGLRRWLGRVARNFALRAREQKHRRMAKERRAARPEAIRSAQEVFAELQAHRAVARAVVELPEPYRSVLLWRYFDEMSIAAIAARQNIPESTVRTQVSRGLQRVRKTLVREQGGVVAPLCPAVAKNLTTGVLVMSTSAKLGLGLAAAGVLAALLIWSDSPPTLGQTAVPASPLPGTLTAAPAEEPGPGPRDGLLSNLRTEMPPSQRAPLVEGRVVDDRGRAVAGVPLHAVAPAWSDRPSEAPQDPEGESLGFSGPDGSFAVPGETAPCDLVAGEGFATLRGAPVDPDDLGAPRLMVVAPSIRLSGRVVDPWSRPLSDVQVGAVVSALRGFPHGLETSSRRGFPIHRTDGDGRFALQRVPGTSQAEVRFFKPGYRYETWTCGPDSREDLVIVLRPIAGDGSGLTGQVLDAAGHPVAGAGIAYGASRTESDPSGMFHVPWQDSGLLRIWATGHQPIDLWDFTRDAWVERGRAVPVVFQLGGAALSIEGILLGPDGIPVAGMSLTLPEIPLVHGETRSPEQLAAGREGSSLDYARTDGSGRFSIGGLSEREYRLRFFDPETLLSITTGPLMAGSTDIVVRIPADAMRRPFRGRLLTPTGEPHAGVEMQLMQQVTHHPTGQLFGERFTTDQNGRFALPEGPRREVRLTLKGAGIPPTTLSIDRYADREDLEIVVPRRCRIRFLSKGTDVEADFVVPLDREGNRLQMLAASKGSSRSYGRWALDGPSPELLVPEAAVTLAYFKDGALVHERPLSLVPGQLNLIQP